MLLSLRLPITTCVVCLLVFLDNINMIFYATSKDRHVIYAVVEHLLIFRSARRTQADLALPGRHVAPMSLLVEDCRLFSPSWSRERSCTNA